MVTVGSLFAGAGGICLAFNNAGANVIWANEIDPHACQTYRHNLCKSNNYLVEGDIQDVLDEDIPKFDILTAGFPCQPFSIAGYRDGFDDERGHLFFEILRVIKVAEPKAIFLENVKNLVGHDKGRTFSIIKRELSKLGYHLKEKVLTSMKYGNVPQDRERIYIVGFKEKHLTDGFRFPDEIPLTKTFRDILEKGRVNDKYYYNRFSFYDEIKNKITQDTVYQWRRVYLRENKTGVCPTLTANMGTGGHNVPLIHDGFDIRKFTPKETALLQGFPEDWFDIPISDSHVYKQVGNAVTVTVVERIASNMLEMLERSSSYKNMNNNDAIEQLEAVKVV